MTERQFLYTTIHPFPVGMPNGIFKIEPIEPGSMDGNPSFGLD